MKATIAVTLALGVLATASALAQADKDKDVAGGGKPPAGWSVKPDKDAPVANVKFVPMGSGYHVTLGPAAILYNTATGTVGPKFHTVASFTQMKAPMHPEGYGIFFAGKDLDGANQSYIYFLIRGDGTYLVKKRTGAETSSLVDWTPNAAVNKAGDDGKATNKIEVDAAGDKVNFIVNGKSVYSMDKAGNDPSGVVGLRVNHNLDVHVEGFAAHKL
ncbi:MAG: hypothetical protein ABI647_00235 [Gemmatimonadota bacterium]